MKIEKDFNISDAKAEIDWKIGINIRNDIATLYSKNFSPIVYFKIISDFRSHKTMTTKYINEIDKKYMLNSFFISLKGLLFNCVKKEFEKPLSRFCIGEIIVRQPLIMPSKP